MSLTVSNHLPFGCWKTLFQRAHGITAHQREGGAPGGPLQPIESTHAGMGSGRGEGEQRPRGALLTRCHALNQFTLSRERLEGHCRWSDTIQWAQTGQGAQGLLWDRHLQALTDSVLNGAWAGTGSLEGGYICNCTGHQRHKRGR